MTDFKFITTRDNLSDLYVCTVRYCNSATHRLFGAVGSSAAEAEGRARDKLHELARDLQTWVLLNQQSEVAVTQPVDAQCPADVPAPETPHPPDSPCPECDGTGFSGNWIDCETCGRMNYEPDETGEPCEYCNGLGTVPDSESESKE